MYSRINEFRWPLFDQTINEQQASGEFALQIGANDGQLVDPLYPHICEGLRAHLVEPHPDYFSELEALHQDRPHVTLSSVAVGKQACTQTLYYLDSEVLRDLPACAKGTASFDQDHILRFGKIIGADLENQISEIAVPVKTYSQLLDDLPAAPDILIVDTEGHDIEIVTASLLDDRPDPRVIMFEHEHAELSEYERLMEKLTLRGFIIAGKTKDETLAVRT